MRIELARIGWDETHIREAIALAQRVAKWNGNRKGVAEVIDVVTDSLDVVYQYPIKRHPQDHANLGCTYYHSCWHPETRTMKRHAVIYVAPDKHASDFDRVRTFVHEVAHTLTQGSHGFTFRRMYSMLMAVLPRIFSFDAVDIHREALNVVQRYGVRYQSTYSLGTYANADEDQWLSRMDKIDAEAEKHFKAALRAISEFGGK